MSERRRAEEAEARAAQEFNAAWAMLHERPNRRIKKNLEEKVLHEKDN